MVAPTGVGSVRQDKRHPDYQLRPPLRKQCIPNYSPQLIFDAQRRRTTIRLLLPPFNFSLGTARQTEAHKKSLGDAGRPPAPPPSDGERRLDHCFYNRREPGLKGWSVPPHLEEEPFHQHRPRDAVLHRKMRLVEWVGNQGWRDRISGSSSRTVWCTRIDASSRRVMSTRINSRVPPPWLFFTSPHRASP